MAQTVPQAHSGDNAVHPLLVGWRRANSMGRVMFSMAVSVGTRLNAWKMNPTRSRRSRVNSLSVRVLRSVSPMKARPSVRSSSAAMHCMSVDLPDPDGPMIAVNWPFSKVMFTPLRARTSISPEP